jgi:hypothetical protein
LSDLDTEIMRFWTERVSGPRRPMSDIAVCIPGPRDSPRVLRDVDRLGEVNSYGRICSLSEIHKARHAYRLLPSTEEVFIAQPPVRRGCAQRLARVIVMARTCNVGGLQSLSTGVARYFGLLLERGMTCGHPCLGRLLCFLPSTNAH